MSGKQMILSAGEAGELLSKGNVTVRRAVSTPCGAHRADKISPYEVGDVVAIREPWHQLKDADGQATGRYIYAADTTAEPVGFKWSSPVAMPSLALRQWGRVTQGSREGTDDVYLLERVAEEDRTSSVGVCVYCGQVVELGRAYMDTVSADKAATERCRCDEAILDRKIEKRKREARERVEQIFGPDASEKGFPPVTDGETMGLLYELAEIVAVGKAQTAQLELSQYGRAKIKITGGGGVKVSRQETRRYEMETL